MIQILLQVNPRAGSNEDCLEKDSGGQPVCIRKSPGNYCMVFKNQNGTQQVKHPRSRPFLASNVIKKREWYIHFLINYLRFVEDMNDTRDKKMIAIIDNFSVIYILGGVS